MSIKMKVTPQVLFWARDSSGYSVADIVKKFNQERITPEVVKAWERGKEQPTYAQLEKLAKTYKRPLAIFFFPSPPKETSIEKLRSLPEAYSKELPPEIRYLVREAMARQIDLSELHGGIAPEEIQTFKRKISNIPQENPKVLAAEMRKIIGTSLEEQTGWGTADEALKHWRSKLENFGIWIFKKAFKNNNYCGFYLPHDTFPIFCLNNSMEERQIFTLFHELGHLLIGKGGIDFRQNVSHEFRGQYQKDEVFCNAFAASFLVPDDNFKIPTNITDEIISDYAEKYKVSREVILRKLLDQGRVGKEFYNKKIREWHKLWENKKKRGDGSAGGDYYATQKAYLGEKYLTLAFKQYHQHRIDEYQLADHLGVKVRSLANLEEYFLKVVDIFGNDTMKVIEVAV